MLGTEDTELMSQLMDWEVEEEVEVVEAAAAVAVEVLMASMIQIVEIQSQRS